LALTVRVLVTRPALSGARTAKKLEARGHEPLLMPLTTAVHDLEATRMALATSAGAIAATSAEAIRALQLLSTQTAAGDADGTLALYTGRPLFAVGKATAERAAKIGFSTVLHSNGDGMELADLIAGHQLLLGHHPLTYLAGFPRASGLEAGLSTHGIAFDTVECYRMQSVEPSETALQHFLFDDPVDAILFYSRHTAENFFKLGFVSRYMDRLKNTRLLCLSATIATIVPYALRSQVEIASVPEEDSLLDLLDTEASANLI
jgi:uroporphyrinogen-III synthase